MVKSHIVFTSVTLLLIFFLTQSGFNNASCFQILLIINPLHIKGRISCHRLLKINFLCIQRPAAATEASAIDQRVIFLCTFSEYRENTGECANHLGT